MPTLTQMQYAVAVGRHGTFVAAARACHVTQPTLSNGLAKLEDELGGAVFDRASRPTVPTALGELILPRFERILAEVEDVLEVARGAGDIPRGPFRLGIIPTIAPELLPQLLAPFRDACPEVQLSVREMTTDQIVAALAEDALDAAILATPLDIVGLHEERLYDEPFWIYASADCPLGNARTKTLSVDALPMDQLIVMLEGHCLRTQVLDVCGLRDGASGPRFALETGSLDTLRHVVDTGPWFTFLPELTARNERVGTPSGRLFALRGDIPYREVALVYRRPAFRRATREAIAETIRSVVPPKMARPPSGGRRVDPT